MEAKTYYMTLGVARTESAKGIRAAYRDLAKRLHPDVAGEQATRGFQELTEAYVVLSDPRRRSEYNRQLRLAEREEVSPAGHSSEDPVIQEPVTILGHPEAVRPSFEAMWDRIIRNFTGIGVPKSEGLESLNLELLLTPEEAYRGCVIPVGVPVFEVCPQCRGSGRDWGFPCTVCQAQGTTEAETFVRVRIPPLAKSGAVLEFPLEGLGIHNFYLRFHIFVGT